MGSIRHAERISRRPRGQVQVEAAHAGSIGPHWLAPASSCNKPLPPSRQGLPERSRMLTMTARPFASLLKVKLVSRPAPDQDFCSSTIKRFHLCAEFGACQRPSPRTSWHGTRRSGCRTRPGRWPQRGRAGSCLRCPQTRPRPSAARAVAHAVRAARRVAPGSSGSGHGGTGLHRVGAQCQHTPLSRSPARTDACLAPSPNRGTVYAAPSRSGQAGPPSDGGSAGAGLRVTGTPAAPAASPPAG